MKDEFVPQRPRLQTRGELILSTAVDAFGQRGYAGASLRKIAASAGVSLSLLSHHYGSKPGLLQAVVNSLHAACDMQLSNLRASLSQAFELSELVSAWVRYAQDVYGTRHGFPFLRLMLRLQSDPEVAPEVRLSLDASNAPVIRRLRQLFPLAEAEDVQLAWTLTSGALYAALCDAVIEARADALTPSRTAALENFLEGGISKLLSDACLDRSDAPSTRDARERQALAFILPIAGQGTSAASLSRDLAHARRMK